MPNVDDQPTNGHILDHQVADGEDRDVGGHIKRMGHRTMPPPKGPGPEKRPERQGRDGGDRDHVDQQARHGDHSKLQPQEFVRRLPGPVQNAPERQQVERDFGQALAFGRQPARLAAVNLADSPALTRVMEPLPVEIDAAQHP